jgi:WD40 repeat protein
VSRLDEWARAHASTVRVGADLEAAAGNPGPPAAGLPPPVDRIVAEPELLLEVQDTSRPNLYAVAVVAWYAGPGREPLLAVGGDAGSRLRDPASGLPVREFGEQGGYIGQGGSGYATSLAVATVDGWPLVATSDYESSGIRIWHGETADLVATVPEGADALAWTTSATGQPMLAVTGPSSVFVCDPFAPAERIVLAEDARVGGGLCITCGTGLNGQPVIAACGGEWITTWDLGRRAAPSASTVPYAADSANCLAWGKTAEGTLLLGIGGSDGTVMIWDTGRDEKLYEAGFHGEIYGIGWGATQDRRILLATGGADSTVRISEPFSGAELAVITHPDEVNTVAFAPAGTVLAQDPGGPAGTETLYLATGSDDGYVRVYAVRVPAATSAPRSAAPRAHEPRRGGEPVRGRLEPIGAIEAAGPPVSLPARWGWVWGSEWAVTADGRARLACTGMSDEVAVLDPFTGETVAELAAGGSTTGVSWGRHPDGRLILAAVGPGCHLRVWDGTDWRATPQTFASDRGEAEAVDLVTAGGRLLAAVATSPPILVTIWDVASGDRLAELELEPEEEDSGVPRADSVAWLADGDDLLLAVSSTSGKVSVLRPLSSATLDTFETDGTAAWSVAWARADGGRLLLATGVGGPKRPAEEPGPGLVVIWDGRTGELMATLDTGVREVISVDWGVTAGGRLFLAVGAAHAVQIWDPSSGRQLARIPAAADVHTVSCAPAGVRPDAPGLVYVAAGQHDGQVLIHALRVTEAAGAEVPGEPEAPGNLVPRGRLEPLDGVRFMVPAEPDRALAGHSGTVWAVRPAMTPDGRVLLASAGQDGTARVWDLASGESLATLACGSAAESVAWSPAAGGYPRLATAGLTTPARTWEMAEDGIRQLSEFDSARRVSWVTGDGGTLLVAMSGMTPDTVISLCHPETGASVAEFRSDGRSVARIEGVEVDGQAYLASGSYSGEIVIWDSSSGDVRTTLTGHHKQIAGLAWAADLDGRLLLASAALDDTVRIWDVPSGECLGTIQAEARGAPAWAVLDDGRLVLAISLEGGFCLCDPVRCVEMAGIEPTGSGGGTGGGVALIPARGGRELSVAVVRSGDIRVFRVGVEGAARAVGQPPRASVGAGEVLPLVSGVVDLGERGVWVGLGLVGDLVELLDPAAGARPLADRLNEPERAVLVSDPALAALRGLGWRGVRSRCGLAGLIASELAPGPSFTPPPGTGRGERETALVRALAAAVPYRAEGTGPEELRRALRDLPPGVVTLLEVVGEDAVFTDPGLSVQLTAAAASLPVLGADVLSMVSRSVRRLDRAEPAPDRAGGDHLDLSQDPVDHDLVPVLTRRGRPDRIIPTQLALPPQVRVPLQAANGLLYRHHAARPAVAPRPVTVLLDVSPAVFGPVELVLRLAAHLLTVTAWRSGGQVSLVTTARPRVVMPLERRGDLVTLWTARTLDPPDLHVAALTAAGLEQSVVALTHHATALDQGLRSGPGLTVITTDTPGTPTLTGQARRGQAAADYRRLPPRPTPDELTALVNTLLDDLSTAGQGT